MSIDQLGCIKYLIFYFKNINPNKYISTAELIGNLNLIRAGDMKIHYFRSKVIAKLRDAGVIIASSNKGYKLPANEKDLYEFINHSNAIIAPMLSRIKKCRDRVHLASKGKMDILDKIEYLDLKKILN